MHKSLVHRLNLAKLPLYRLGLKRPGFPSMLDTGYFPLRYGDKAGKFDLRKPSANPQFFHPFFKRHGRRLCIGKRGRQRLSGT